MLQIDQPPERQDPVATWRRNIAVVAAKPLFSCRFLALYLATTLASLILIGAVGPGLLTALLILMVPLSYVTFPGMRLLMAITDNHGVLTPGMRAPWWAYLRAALYLALVAFILFALARVLIREGFCSQNLLCLLISRK